MIAPLIIPVSPIFSAVSAWLNSLRRKFLKDSRNPYIKSDVEIFGFEDASRLPSAENDAVALAESQIAGGDFEAAKHTLVMAWKNTPDDTNRELAYIRLRQGFVKLYAAGGDDHIAERIANMPTLLLDREVQNIVTHPNEQIGGSAIVANDESNESEK